MMSVKTVQKQFCGKCGNDVTDKRFCPKCGTPVAEVNQSHNQNQATAEDTPLTVAPNATSAQKSGNQDFEKTVNNLLAPNKIGKTGFWIVMASGLPNIIPVVGVWISLIMLVGGLYCCIKGLKVKPRGLAIAGIVISVVGLILGGIIGLLLFFATGSPTSTNEHWVQVGETVNIECRGGKGFMSKLMSGESDTAIVKSVDPITIGTNRTNKVVTEAQLNEYGCHITN